jgi:hypothetical protein
MDLDRLIAELVAERARLDDAIEVLDRLCAGNRRGRPPKWLAQMRDAGHKQVDESPEGN